MKCLVSCWFFLIRLTRKLAMEFVSRIPNLWKIYQWHEISIDKYGHTNLFDYKILRAQQSQKSKFVTYFLQKLIFTNKTKSSVFYMYFLCWLESFIGISQELAKLLTFFEKWQNLKSKIWLLFCERVLYTTLKVKKWKKSQ